VIFRISRMALAVMVWARREMQAKRSGPIGTGPVETGPVEAGVMHRMLSAAPGFPHLSRSG